jgi:hypothetical protein
MTAQAHLPAPGRRQRTNRTGAKNIVANLCGVMYTGATMYQPRHRRNITTMWLLVLVSLFYLGGLTALHTFTGMPRIDGSIGIVLGLFICSRPASNLVDLVLFSRTIPWQTSSRRADVIWLGLNVLAMIAGCVVLFSGAVRLAGVRA